MPVDEEKGRGGEDGGDAKESSQASAAAAPSSHAASIKEGYNQTYVIMNRGDAEETKRNFGYTEHDVFFRCGNWCYKGPIDFMGLQLGLHQLPVVIPTLQRQQQALKYFCLSKAIPPTSPYFDPIELFYKANDFIAEEITSDKVTAELKKWSHVFSWIEDESATTYFELTLEPHPCMRNVAMMASKTYNRGLIIISIYIDSTLYFIMQNGEGDQHLLDVRFPDVSKRGQGLHLGSYYDSHPTFRKLTLWHSIPAEPTTSVAAPVRPVVNNKVVDISSTEYIQSYCVMRSQTGQSNPSIAAMHDAIFRFGSWCYAGSVQLTPSIGLSDIPFVIPALRMQQSKLQYFCDVKHLPETSKFARPLEFASRVAPAMEEQIVQSEEALRALIDRLNRMQLGDSVSRWLEGDSEDSFFEFKFTRDDETERILADVELIATKAYHASGIITVTIIYDYTAYVIIMEAGMENPLLDSKFPDVSSKGRGYQLSTFQDGVPAWPQLRKVSIWQTVEALEQEFRERASQIASAKASLGEDAAKAFDEADNAADDDFEFADAKDAAVTKPTSTAPVTIESAPAKAVDRVADDKTSPALRANIQPAKEDKLQTSLSADAEVKTETVPATTSTAAPSTAPARLLPMSRPHHLPKMDNALAKKMEEIRRTMGSEGSKPNWSATGSPLSKDNSNLSHK